MNDLTKRAEAVKARIALRAWEYRQRNGAKGTWFRLRRLLARASEAYAIDDRDAAELIAEGVPCDPVGDELEPRRRYFVVPRHRIERITSKRPLVVRMSAELLSERNLVLIPF